MNCQQFTELARRAPLFGMQCREDGTMLRLHTPLTYPDGGFVELYVETRGSAFVVTDFGEAFRFLMTSGIDPLRSPTRERMINLARELGNATLEEDTFEIEAKEEDLMPAIMRLGQVVSRVADLSLLIKGAFANTFSDTLEDFLRETTRGTEIRRRAIVPGASTSHEVDILAKSVRGQSVVEGLSSVTPAGAASQTAFTVAKFLDISLMGPGSPARYAMLDDSEGVWSASLRSQLSHVAEVIDWEQRDKLAAAISG